MARSEVVVPLGGLSAPRDQLARPLRDLRISVMDRCNFRCPYCMPRETFHEKYRFLSSRERVLSINIPAGIEDGTRIRLAGEGEAGLHGGPPGDLYILLSIAPHAFFRRDGADLHCQVPISTSTASLGGQVEIHAINSGQIHLKIPKGTQVGQRLRLRGKGMPVLRSKKMGDMYVQVVVEMPTK